MLSKLAGTGKQYKLAKQSNNPIITEFWLYYLLKDNSNDLLLVFKRNSTNRHQLDNLIKVMLLIFKPDMAN